MNNMKYNIQDIGSLIYKTRKEQGLTQQELALASGTGNRFIIDLEKGKPTCEISKVLDVLNILGIIITLTPPSFAEDK